MERTTKILLGSLFVVGSVIGWLANSREQSEVNNPTTPIISKEGIGNKTLIHLNNSYVFDLSNRTMKSESKRVSDIDMVNYFVNQMDTKFRKAFNRKSVIQKDIHRIQTTSSELYNQFDVKVDNLTCDFSQFKKPADLSNYLFDRNIGEESMKSWKMSCINEFTNLYNKAQKHSSGADIYSYIKTCDRYFGKKLSPIQMGKTKHQNQYKNNLFLVTDGYIEYGLYNNDKVAPYLSKNRIDAFKQAYKNKGQGMSIADFFSQEGYGITPTFSDAHKNINVLVIGFEDRSIDEFGIAKKGVLIRDREVMELFWNDWLNKSGFTNVKIAPVLNSISELDELVMGFIEN